MSSYYNGNLRKALIKLFPDIGLDETKFINKFAGPLKMYHNPNVVLI